MKKFALVLPLALLSSTAFAEDVASGSPVDGATLKACAFFFAVAFAAYSGTTAQSKAAAAALEGIARNPAAADKIMTPMILALALMESLVIFTLISGFFLK